MADTDGRRHDDERMTGRPRRDGRDPVESRSVAWLVLIAGLLFQSHWVDDLGGSENDVAGIAVSALGTIALLAGLLGIRTTPGRILLALGLAFVAWVSVADLIGLRSDGTRTTDVIGHWRSTLGWPFTFVVAATLAVAGAATMRLAQATARRRAVR